VVKGYLHHGPEAPCHVAWASGPWCVYSRIAGGIPSAQQQRSVLQFERKDRVAPAESAVYRRCEGVPSPRARGTVPRGMGLWPMVRVLTHGRWYSIGTQQRSVLQFERKDRSAPSPRAGGTVPRGMGLWPMVRVFTYGRWYSIGTATAKRSSIRTQRSLRSFTTGRRQRATSSWHPSISPGLWPGSSGQRPGLTEENDGLHDKSPCTASHHRAT
jgi:hypothetical protein